MNVIDLFAGCGGLTDGFLKTGSFRTLAAVDWEIMPIETLQKRFLKQYKYSPADVNEKVFTFDIQRTEELLNGFHDPHYGKGRGLIDLVGKDSVDLIIGGPPCQAYSIAGRVQDKDGMRNDYRNYLFESYVKIVDYFKPKYFVFENVPGMLSAKPDGELVTTKISRAFRKIGYKLSDDFRNTALFDLSHFGIPQKRKRVIIFGLKKGLNEEFIDDFYRNLNLFKNEKPCVLGSTLSDLPKLIPIQNNVYRKKSHAAIAEHKYKNHIPRFHNARDIEIFNLLTNDIKTGKRKYKSGDALRQLYTEKVGKVSRFVKYHVLDRCLPSNTIPAHLYKDGLKHIHPDPLQSRSITVREAARLQSFDDSYEFLGAMGDQYKMVGNAVPPKFSKLIAQSILRLEK